MITVKNLVFEYPGRRALDDINFELKDRTITALIGPNGAGKTTLMRCLVGLELPAEGQITVGGIDVRADPRGVHKIMTYLPDFFGLYDELTVRQSLAHRAAARNLPPKDHGRLIEQAAARMGLLNRMNDKAGALSRGLRQRLAIAQAILHEPRVILLDEPASGLDPEARLALSAVLRELCAEGMTLLVSSHILSELEDYSTDMLILRGGRLIDQRGVHDLSADPSARQALISVTLVSPLPDLPDRLAGLDGVQLLGQDGRTVTLSAPGAAEKLHELLAALIARGVPVCGFDLDRTRLKEAYLARALAGRTISLSGDL